MRALLVAAMLFFGQTPFGHLVDVASQSEEVLHTPYGDYHVLKHIEPADVTQTHDAEYFSVVGGMYKGKFYADHVEMVSERWVHTTHDVWNIDQWLFTVSLTGELVRASHNRLHEDDNGTVLPSEDPPAPTDAEADAMFKKHAVDWLKFVEA